MIKVKAHKRKGKKVRAHTRKRKVLSHGRIKKQNKALSRGWELTKAIERSMDVPAESLEEHLKAIRTNNKTVWDDAKLLGRLIKSAKWLKDDPKKEREIRNRLRVLGSIKMPFSIEHPKNKGKSKLARYSEAKKYLSNKERERRKKYLGNWVQ